MVGYPSSHRRGSSLQRDVLSQKLYQAKCSASAARRFDHFLENPFVRRVSLRTHIRIVKFCRST